MARLKTGAGIKRPVRRPSTGSTQATAGTRLREALSSIEDTLAAVGGFLARVARGFTGALGAFWGDLSIQGRRRLLAALGAAVALLLLLAAVVPSLPCEFPGGDSCPPPDDAIALVPSDALAYAHANLDPDTEQYDDAAGIAESLPVIRQQIAARALGLVPGPRGGAPGFERDIAPWFGGEVALAALPGRGDRALLLVDLLEVDDADGATAFARELGSGRQRVFEYEGVEISVSGGESHVASAQVDGFLALGTPAGVRAVIDASGAEADSLADDQAASDARNALPDHRLIDAYVSPEGARELASPAGPLGSFSPLISPQATRGAAVALATDGGELELAVRSVLDADRARSQAGFFAAFEPFDPSLASKLSSDALVYVGIGDPGEATRKLLAQAGATAPGIASSFEDLVDQLRRGEFDLSNDFFPALGDEGAFALEPRTGDTGVDPTPYFQFIADGVDEDRARRALAGLQRPVAAAVEPQSVLQTPSFQDEEVEGVQIRTLPVSGAVELTYAVFDGLATVATSPDGIAKLARGDGGLDESERYRQATNGFDGDPSLLAYFDLGELIAVGERLGLAEDPAYATFAGEFRTLEALGVAISSGEDILRTDARLIVGPPPAEPAEAEAPVPSD